MTHPNEDDGLERFNIWKARNKPETKDLAWWKGECVRLGLELGEGLFGEHAPQDMSVIRCQYIAALGKVMDLERIAGMK